MRGGKLQHHTCLGARNRLWQSAGWMLNESEDGRAGGYK